ncbi:MAG: LytTR family DNA-binding domain-containing protein [Bacteroidota bacterium]
MIRTIIIEDEELAVNRLKRLLQQTAPELEVVDSLSDVVTAIAYLSNHQEKLDLIFLDIHLADGSSFDIFEQIEIQVPIIFTTAYDQYALKAFKQNSVDYLLKPIGQQELKASIDKFRKWHTQGEVPTQIIDYQQLATIVQQQTTPSKQRFLVHVGAKIRAIETKDIAYFYSEQGSTFLTTYQGQTYDVSYTLEKLITQLPTDQFYRVNRKIIVQLSAIQEAYYFSSTRLKLQLKPPPSFDVFVPIDRLVEFKNWMSGE